MLSYSQIIKRSYVFTVQNPLLWLFGLFVVGGFNLNFLYFQDIPLRALQDRFSFADFVSYFQSHPSALFAVSLLTLVVTAGLLVLTNWCRILLVLSTKDYLQNDKQTTLTENFKQGPKFLWRVIKISLLTSFLMFLVSVGLLAAPFFLVKNPASQAFLWTIGVVFLIPLAFTISGVNIFTGFFIIAFNQPLKKALDLGTDLFVTHWAKILGLSAILMVIYSAGFISGAVILYLVREIFGLLLVMLSRLGVSGFSALITAARIITGIFLWVLLAGLNVFFNTALLLLFLQLTAPAQGEKEKNKQILPLPASSSV